MSDMTKKELEAENQAFRDALHQIASMKCPDKDNCKAYDRAECMAGQAREALSRRSGF